MNPSLNRRIFRGESEGVPPHGMQYVVASHPPIAGNDIPDGIIPHMAHVNFAGGIRKHFQEVVLGKFRVLRHPEALVILPDLLPPLFNLFGLVFFVHGSTCAYLEFDLKLIFGPA